ncbi:MAG: ATP-binding cassette domain-containing protein [Labilithrix sp.]|nr:ATP-binding cassette domain-containing protein [Labilithrix sp.]
MSDAALSVRLALTPQGDAQTLHIDVAFEVPPGVTVLFGPSGAGKSRTLACIAGLVRPERGRVALGDDVWFDAGESREVPIHARRVAYVFQSLALFPHMTAADNVAYGLPRDLPREERRARAVAMLTRMHVAGLADRRPRTFSGGEAQRVALARAFAMKPRVVLLDEPFSALDAGLKTELLRELGVELAALRVPTILVTHQPEDAALLGERVVFLEKGRVSRTAPMSERPFG